MRLPRSNDCPSDRADDSCKTFLGVSNVVVLFGVNFSTVMNSLYHSIKHFSEPQRSKIGSGLYIKMGSNDREKRRCSQGNEHLI